MSVRGFTDNTLEYYPHKMIVRSQFVYELKYQVFFFFLQLQANIQPVCLISSLPLMCIIKIVVR